MSMDLIAGIIIGTVAAFIPGLVRAIRKRKRVLGTVRVRREHYDQLRQLGTMAQYSETNHKNLWSWIEEHYPQTREGQWSVASNNDEIVLIRWNR